MDDFESIKKICEMLNTKEVKFMVTLNKNEQFMEMFKDFNIELIEKRSIVNYKAIEHEMIITN